MPARGLKELIAWLQANPNKASAASVAASLHLVTALFQKETRTQFTLVPYRGEAAVGRVGHKRSFTHRCRGTGDPGDHRLHQS
jgi:tripartite-type tricarboxylate transporter receptor subunit TctC